MDDLGEAVESQGDWDDVSVSLEAAGGGIVDVYVRPTPLVGFGEDLNDDGTRVRVLRVDVVEGALTMFPMNNLDIPMKGVEPKYGQVERISFVKGGKSDARLRDGDVGPQDAVPTSVGDVMELLEALPRYCVKEPRFGLGFRKQFRAVVHAIEGLTGAREIRIAGRGETGYEEESRTFIVSGPDMLTLAKAIERVDRTTRTAANTVNETTMHNKVADILGLPRRPMKYGRSALRQALTAVANDERPLSEVEQEELVGTLARNAVSMLKRGPAVIEGLESEIAIARASDLLANLKGMMKERLPERAWQEFLQGNPFMLSMVFGRPIVKVSNQASVGSRRIDGSGDKIADFLVRNSLTNNAALVEIKTPASKLLNMTPYRSKVYAPAAELVGAINQALDQKSKFEQEIASIRNRNRSLNVEAYHVHACVLAGTMPTGEDQVRSFELFRHNLKDVAVVTFDELVLKVEDLCSFLQGGQEDEGGSEEAVAGIEPPI